MNIVVVYGEHITESRKRYFSIVETAKDKGWEIIKLDNFDNSVSEIISNKSLFQTDTLYILEDISKLKDSDFNYLKNSQKININLIIWLRGNLSSIFKKKLPKGVKFERFDLPRKIFKFLESFYPGNSKESFCSFHEVLIHENAEFILALLTRQLRDLYLYKLNSQNINYPNWRKAKIKFQAERFTKTKLVKIINKLAKADLDSKTGGPSLELSLDLIIEKELE